MSPQPRLHKTKGLASLFDEYELKNLFRSYVRLLLVIEVLIFLVCWVYQLGLSEIGLTGKAAGVSFPWKIYFLVSFAAPLAITFVAGIVVVGFNSFIFGWRGTPLFKDKSGTPTGKLARAANFLAQLPILFTLVFLGIALAIFYNIQDIIFFLGQLGASASRFLLIASGLILISGTILAVTHLILKYKLRQKDMEYAYRRELMDRLGIAIMDDKTIINRQGQIIHTHTQDIFLPQTTALPAGEKELSDNVMDKPKDE
ncbi:MAG: hypothetical protein RBR42_10210 [Desulfomicrobium sp.]|nr:hypothetical protein [Desulfomicrobium sp.]NLV96995.1 hypothetical protein [Desulfovibrionales bacterium]